MITGVFVQSYSVPNLNINLIKNKITDVYISEHYLKNNTKASETVKKLQNENIKVHAWVFCFNKDGRWIDPSDQITQETIQQKIINLLSLKPDGITLDYIRYPGTAYKQKNATNIINNFASRIRNTLPKSIELSACVMPECSANACYYGQDYSTLSQYLTLIPMVYKGNYKAPTTWIKDVCTYIRKVIGPKKFLAALQTYKSDTHPIKLGITELIEDITNGIRGGSNGVVLFHYDYVPNNFFTNNNLEVYDQMTQDIPIHTFKSMIERYNKYKKENKREPRIVYIKDKNGPYVTIKQFKIMLQFYYEYLSKNGKEPPQIKIPEAPPITKPDENWALTGYFTEDLQDTSFTCGPSSLSMALSALNCNISEAELAKMAGTTSTGTTSTGIIKAVRKASQKCKINLTCTNPSFKSTGWDKIINLLNNNCEIIIHLMTYPHLAYDNKGNPVWKGNYGHFTYLVGVNPIEKLVKIADPSKGIRTFTFKQMENAMAAVTWSNSLYIICKGK